MSQLGLREFFLHETLIDALTKGPDLTVYKVPSLSFITLLKSNSICPSYFDDIITGDIGPDWRRQDQGIHGDEARWDHRHLHHRRGGGDHRGGLVLVCTNLLPS